MPSPIEHEDHIGQDKGNDSNLKQGEIKALALLLQEAIGKNDIREVVKLLRPVKDQKHINAICEQMEGSDPLIQAIEQHNETIAIHLLEKGFNFKILYTYPEQSCNHQCYYDHGDGQCPSQYSAASLAGQYNLGKVKQLMDAISSGNHAPGNEAITNKNIQSKKLIQTSSLSTAHLKPQLGMHKDDVFKVTQKLMECIGKNDLSGVQETLQVVQDSTAIQQILSQDESTDPLMCAIENRCEPIALFLLEKGFPYNRPYTYPDKLCNQWCYLDHQGTLKCPESQYDSSDMAEKYNLKKVKSLIDDIENGHRKPGEGIASPRGGATVHPTKNITEDRLEGLGNMLSMRLGHTMSPADMARKNIQEHSSQFTDSDGDSLLHKAALDNHPSPIYVYTRAGTHVNHKNKNGDTALHVAIKRGHRDIIEALLQCGADPLARNKNGQTVISMVEGTMKTYMSSYRDGMLSTITKGSFNSVQKLVKMWCSPNTIIKNGETAMELGKSLGKSNQNIQKCYRFLKEQNNTLELIHAVLAEDIEAVEHILADKKNININMRHNKSKTGKTALSCAIDLHNFDIVKTLIERGKASVNIRVQENAQGDCTIPLMFKAFTEDSPVEMAKYMWHRRTMGEKEKDRLGNTLFLRAIEENMPVDFIKWLLTMRAGHCVVERNKDGVNARELAIKMKRIDVMQAIDEYIMKNLKHMFVQHLIAKFYGSENLQISQMGSGKTPNQLALEKRDNELLDTLNNVETLQQRGVKLLEAASEGNQDDIQQHNILNFQDRNGYSALIKAIVHNQFKAAEQLVITRPVLRGIPDNCNRYPLHYAYSLPDDQAEPFLALIMERNPREYEESLDKDGRKPAEYKSMRGSELIEQILIDARTLDPV